MLAKFEKEEGFAQKMDLIVGQIVSILVSLASKGVEGLIKKASWKNAFKKATEEALSFSEELAERFAKLQSKEIQKSLRKATGYSFYNSVKNAIEREIMSASLKPDDFAKEIDIYIEALGSFLLQKFPGYAIQLSLGQIQDAIRQQASERKKEYEQILARLDALEKINIEINDLYEEENVLLDKGNRNIRLGFNSFWFDYKGNIDSLENGLKEKDVLFLSCFDKEEVKYQLLNYLSSKANGFSILVVKNRESWQYLRKKKLQGAYLVMDFDVGEKSVEPIKGNKNIFLLNDAEANNRLDSQLIKIRRRALENIRLSLEEASTNQNFKSKVYQIVAETNGIYSNLRRYIYTEVADQSYKYDAEDLPAILCGLLLGKFELCRYFDKQEPAYDSKTITKLYSGSWAKFTRTIRNYSSGNHPIFTTKKEYSNKFAVVSDFRFAWKCFAKELDDDLWKKFIGLLPEILFEENTPACPSKKLKEGVCETLLAAQYLVAEPDGVPFDKNRGREFVLSFLQNEKTPIFWSRFANYSRVFAELDPSHYLDFLKKNAGDPLLAKLFAEDSANATKILWALEALSRNAQWQENAIDCLFELNKYVQEPLCKGNTPEKSLTTILVGWLDQCGLGYQEKKKILEKHKDDGWRIITNLLPFQTTSVFDLAEPYYLPIKEENSHVNVEDANKLAFLCIKLAAEGSQGGVKRINPTIDSLEYFEGKTQEDSLNKLEPQIQALEDPEKEVVWSHIREKIDWIRYYRPKNQAFLKYAVSLENLLGEIVFRNPHYRYLYLTDFRPGILHPTKVYKEGDFDRGEDERAELEAGAKAFIEEGLNLCEFVSIVNDKGKLGNLGRMLQSYFGELLDGKTFENLCQLVKTDNEKYYFFYRNLIASKTKRDLKEFEEYFELSKRVLTDEYLAKLLLDYPLQENYPNFIERCSEEIKTLFWSDRPELYRISSHSFLVECLEKSAHYASAKTFFETLESCKERLDAASIYRLLLSLSQEKLLDFKEDYYYYHEIYKSVASYVFSSEERIRGLANVERCLFKNHSEYDKPLEAYQWLLKNDPSEYGKIVTCFFDKEAAKNIPFPYDYFFFFHAKFCPAEDRGFVDKKKLHQWVSSFRDICSAIKDVSAFEHQLGHLFAFSPKGRDGFSPCEAVREEMNDIDDWISDKRAFETAYIVAECNKRGVYTPNGGEGQMALADHYKQNSEALKERWPFLSKIYDDLAESYLEEASNERERAENGIL